MSGSVCNSSEQLISRKYMSNISHVPLNAYCALMYFSFGKCWILCCRNIITGDNSAPNTVLLSGSFGNWREDRKGPKLCKLKVRINHFIISVRPSLCLSDRTCASKVTLWLVLIIRTNVCLRQTICLHIFGISIENLPRKYSNIGNLRNEDMKFFNSADATCSL